jgi:hypothetical protein
MSELIQLLNTLTWPGAIALCVFIAGVCFILRELFK